MAAPVARIEGNLVTLPFMLVYRLVYRLFRAVGIESLLSLPLDEYFPSSTTRDGRIRVVNKNVSILGIAIRLCMTGGTYMFRAVKLLLAPQLLARQLVIVVLLQVVYEAGGHFFKRLFDRVLLARRTKKGAMKASLQDRMDKAETYAEWREANRMLEELAHKAHGQTDREEDDAIARLTERSKRYLSLIEEKNIVELEYLLRGDLMRKHFGLKHKSNATRKALHEYVQVVCSALTAVAMSEHSIDGDEAACKLEQLRRTRKKLKFFRATRQSYGRSALLLSGGARMGLIHIGVIKALLEENLLPKVVSGSSAGALVAAMLGCKTDEEMVDLFDPKKMTLRFFGRVDSIESDLDKLLNCKPDANGSPRSVDSVDKDKSKKKNGQATGFMRLFLWLSPPFLAEALSLFSKFVPRYMATKTLLDVEILQQSVRSIIGDMTFQEAFEKTGRIINITVTPQSKDTDRDFPQLLNYLTTPHVVIHSAAVASCSIPGVFAPVSLLRKDVHGKIFAYAPEGIKWQDGSLESDLPLQRLKELFNVNHFIVSQVNVHARLLAPHREITFANAPLLARLWRTLGAIIMYFRDEVRSNVKHFATFRLGPLHASMSSILTQKYHGDITIVPNFTLKDVLTLLNNPTEADFCESMEKGLTITFPFISTIRRACMTEFLLDECVAALKSRTEELEARLNILSSPPPQRQSPKQVRFSLDAISENTNSDFSAELQRQDSGLTDKLSLQSKLQARNVSVLQLDKLGAESGDI